MAGSVMTGAVLGGGCGHLLFELVSVAGDVEGNEEIFFAEGFYDEAGGLCDLGHLEDAGVAIGGEIDEGDVLFI